MSSFIASLFSPRKQLPGSPPARSGSSPSSPTSAAKGKTPSRKSRVRAKRDSKSRPSNLGTEDAIVNNDEDQATATVTKLVDAYKSPKAASDSKNATFDAVNDTADASRRSLRSPTVVARSAANAVMVPEAAAHAAEVEEEEEEEEEREYMFKRFLDYRWVDDSIELQVEWDKSEPTWEPEANLHRDAPTPLLAYWRSLGGRPTNPSDPGLYEIHAITKHSKNRRRLLVEWVGYGPNDATWEPRTAIEKMAPEIVATYWQSVPKRR